MTKIIFMRASYGSLESLLNYLKGDIAVDVFDSQLVNREFRLLNILYNKRINCYTAFSNYLDNKY
jgi:hypothetical protein